MSGFDERQWSKYWNRENKNNDARKEPLVSRPSTNQITKFRVFKKQPQLIKEISYTNFFKVNDDIVDWDSKEKNNQNVINETSSRSYQPSPVQKKKMNTRVFDKMLQNSTPSSQESQKSSQEQSTPPSAKLVRKTKKTGTLVIVQSSSQKARDLVVLAPATPSQSTPKSKPTKKPTPPAAPICSQDSSQISDSSQDVTPFSTPMTNYTTPTSHKRKLQPLYSSQEIQLEHRKLKKR